MFRAERREVGHYYRILSSNWAASTALATLHGLGPAATPYQSTGAVSNPCNGTQVPPITLRAARFEWAQDEFNRTDSGLLEVLDQAFDGSPQLLGDGTGAMYRLHAQAQAPMQIPTEDGAAAAGPTFEYAPPCSRR
jgi:hypothetical protein